MISSRDQAYQPSRLFHVGLTTNGARRLFVRTHPSGPDLDARMAEGDVIKLEEIAEWFEPLHIVPTGDELEPLKHVLNLMRVTKHQE
jgi:hypothetical protein